LARDVLDADLRWRDRARYADVHRRVRRHVVARIREGAGREQQRAVADLQFLHRGNAGIRGFYDWASLGEGYADGLRAGDAEAVMAMVERFETAESAALTRFWLERQPRAFMVFRRPGRDEPFGFAVMLALHAASAEERAADPGAAAMWAYALAHGAPRPGEEVFAITSYMDAEAYPGAVGVVQRGHDPVGAALRELPAAGVGLHRRVGRPRRDRAVHGPHRLRARPCGRLRGGRSALRRVRTRLAADRAGGVVRADGGARSGR
jgi:hypothetical protein